MNKKYTFTGNTKEVNGVTLQEIISLIGVGIVDAGTVGGYIEDESNLSHKGDCWVSSGCYVYNGSVIDEDAIISGAVSVSRGSVIKDHARVVGNVLVTESRVYDRAYIRSGEGASIVGSRVYDNAQIDGNVFLRNSRVYDNAIIKAGSFDGVRIYNNAQVLVNIECSGDIRIYGGYKIENTDRIYGKCKFYY